MMPWFISIGKTVNVHGCDRQTTSQRQHSNFNLLARTLVQTLKCLGERVKFERDFHPMVRMLCCNEFQWRENASVCPSFFPPFCVCSLGVVFRSLQVNRKVIELRIAKKPISFEHFTIFIENRSQHANSTISHSQTWKGTRNFYDSWLLQIEVVPREFCFTFSLYDMTNLRTSACSRYFLYSFWWHEKSLICTLMTAIKRRKKVEMFIPLHCYTCALKDDD